MNPAMIKKLQKMQKDMVIAQKELEASTFYGSAGGKTVEVEFNGAKVMKGIKINKEALDSLDDLDMVEDTIVIAINNCMKNIDEETEQVMGQFTNSMPGMF